MAKLKQHEKFHLSRLALTALLGVSVLVTHAATNGSPLVIQSREEVLAYATSMSRGDLLDAANSSRAANGLAPLSMNSLLNSAAQAKAQHMIDNNYWAHVAPDGTQPWHFFNSVGYQYVAAGENLAYGFGTGYEVNTGWMNSPSHRANILGNYADVGFGIVNGPSYQGGENTVVVAHYGLTQAAPAPTPPPAAPTPAPAAAAPSTPAPTPTPTPTSQPAPLATETPEPTAPDESSPDTLVNKETKQQTENSPAAVPSETPIAIEDQSESRVTALDQLRNGQVPMAVAASLSIVALSSGGFALTHRQYMRHLIAHGKNFITHHPIVDIALIALAVGVILSTVVGKLL